MSIIYIGFVYNYTYYSIHINTNKKEMLTYINVIHLYEELNINYNRNTIVNERKDIHNDGGVCTIFFKTFYAHVWIGIRKNTERTGNLANCVFMDDVYDLCYWENKNEMKKLFNFVYVCCIILCTILLYICGAIASFQFTLNYVDGN